MNEDMLISTLEKEDMLYATASCNCGTGGSHTVFNFTIERGKLKDDRQGYIDANIRELVKTYQEANKRGETGELELISIEKRQRWLLVFKNGTTYVYRSHLG